MRGRAAPSRGLGQFLVLGGRHGAMANNYSFSEEKVPCIMKFARLHVHDIVGIPRWVFGRDSGGFPGRRGVAALTQALGASRHERS